MTERPILLLSYWLWLAVPIALIGCKREEALDKPLREDTSSSVSANPREKRAVKDYSVILVVKKSLAGRPDYGALEAFLSEIHPETPPDSPALTYLRDNLELLFQAGVLDNFIHAYPAMCEAVKNPELIRLIHKVYASERDAHRFWKTGVSLIAGSGAKLLASGLLEDWKVLPAAPELIGLAETLSVEALHSPRMALARAIFELGDEPTIAKVWQLFPTMGASDQYAMVSSSDSSDRYYTGENLRTLNTLYGSGKNESVTAMLNQYPSHIVLRLLHKCPNEDRPALVRRLAVELALMQKNGTVSEDLAKALHSVGR